MAEQTVDEVLAGKGLPIEVARSMLAAVMLGKTHEVSKYLWMRLLTTYIDICEGLVDEAIATYVSRDDVSRAFEDHADRRLGGLLKRVTSDALRRLPYDVLVENPLITGCSPRTRVRRGVEWVGRALRKQPRPCPTPTREESRMIERTS